MNYIASSTALALVASTPAPSCAAAFVDVATRGAPGESTNVAWVRAMRADGWIFSFKASNCRGGEVMAGNPLDLNDYLLCRPAPGRRDDTEQLIAAMAPYEEWNSRCGEVTQKGGDDPVFGALSEHDEASALSGDATEKSDQAYFAARARLGAPKGEDDRAWYARARLTRLKAQRDAAELRYVQAWHALPMTTPQTVGGAAALIAFVLRDAAEGTFDDSLDGPHFALLANALEAIRGAGHRA